MSFIKPSKSLNNRGIVFGLEVEDIIGLSIILMILRSVLPYDELLLFHLLFVTILGVILSMIRMNQRRGFIRGVIKTFLIDLKKEVLSD